MENLTRLGPRAALIAILSIVLTGCISYESDGSNRGERISEVRKGSTSSSWLSEYLGRPESRHTTDSGSEIWHYEFDEREKTRVSLFLVFRVKTENRSSRDYYFEVRDGVVEDYWQD